MTQIIVDQIVISKEAEYWTIDLDKNNDFSLSVGSIVLNSSEEQFKIVDTYQYRYVKNKLVLIVIKL
jgi:hypothetical protein